MEQQKIKRNRSENWISSDKILLRQLIEEKIHIIENKRVDTNTSKEKRDAWKNILESFNQCSMVKRNLTQIQCQWRGTKMEAKSRISQYKAKRNATGGGPPLKSPDHDDAHLMALIPEEFEVDHNEFDCDATDSLTRENATVEFLIEELDENGNNCNSFQVATPLNDLNEIHNIHEEEMEDDPAAEQSPTLPTQINKTTKTKQTKKNQTAVISSERMKIEMFHVAKEVKVKEMEFLVEEHAEKIKTFKMQQQALETAEQRRQEEHTYKIKAFQNDERRKEEEHKLKLQLLLKQNYD